MVACAQDKNTNSTVKFFKIVFTLILFHIFISNGIEYILDGVSSQM